MRKKTTVLCRTWSPRFKYHSTTAKSQRWSGWSKKGLKVSAGRREFRDRRQMTGSHGWLFPSFSILWWERVTHECGSEHKLKSTCIVIAARTLKVVILVKHASKLADVEAPVVTMVTTRAAWRRHHHWALLPIWPRSQSCYCNKKCIFFALLTFKWNIQLYNMRTVPAEVKKQLNEMEMLQRKGKLNLCMNLPMIIEWRLKERKSRGEITAGTEAYGEFSNP